jgi:hypothetical protein
MGYQIFFHDDTKKVLFNEKQTIKYELEKTQHTTWLKRLSLFDDPQDIIKFKTVKQYWESCPKDNKTYNLVIVQFIVLKGTNKNCQSFLIERITDWTTEVENELIQEIKVEEERTKEKNVQEFDELYDPDYLLTRFDLI